MQLTIKQRDWIIVLGFYEEVAFFIAAGILWAYGNFLSLLPLTLGFIWAYLVGRLIEKNAIEKWKWGIYK